MSLLLIAIVAIIVFVCLSLRQTPLNTTLLTTAIVILVLLLWGLATGGIPVIPHPIR